MSKIALGVAETGLKLAIVRSPRAIQTLSSAISAGVTPLMRAACPNVSGRILANFCVASTRSPLIAA